jgi:integrase
VAAAKQFGPVRPKQLQAKQKGKRQHGIAVASLEMQKLFAQGDWDAIADYATHRLPMYSVAWSTLKGYESSWKHWVSFQYRAQLPIFLRTGTAFERSLSSKWLLSFIALLGFAVGFKPSTIKKCLMAIRFFHLAHDYENPLEKCPRVWQGYKSIKRMVGPTERKFPITPEMMDWLDRVSAWQGLCGYVKRTRNKFGTYLACRSSEYLGPDPHWDKIMLTTDVRPLMGQAYCDWSDAFDGIMARFRGSKTDQYNEGCMRYVGKTGNSRCLIAELHGWVELEPNHFDVTEECVPFFKMPSGKVSTRTELQGDLRAAAVACGVDESRIGTHSLRVTCATWLYQAGYDLEYIKRHGRWVSNVVHVYLWEGSGFHDMSKRMSEVKFTLHAMM